MATPAKLNPVNTGGPHVAAHNAERTAINGLIDETNTKLTLPSDPQVGQMLIWNGSSWEASETRIFEGEGTPEGQVAAPVGSRYIDMTPNSPAVEYLKASGSDTSNTGWITLNTPDSGLRDIRTLVDLRGTGTVNTATLRRWGPMVEMYLDVNTPQDTTSPWLVMTLPAGFRPPIMRHGALQDNNEAAAVSTSVGSDGKVQLYTLTAKKRDRWNGMWMTRDAWPSVLPGVAA